MNKTIIASIAVVIVAIGGFFVWKSFSGTTPPPNTVGQVPPVVLDEGQNKSVEDVPIVKEENKAETVIGKSVEGRDITAYHFGTGDKELLFVGGTHGGYEWNTVLVAYELIDYLKSNPSVIPATTRITVIPVLNPDGLNKVVGTASRFAPSDVPADEGKIVAGRYNANNIDLNRNFDCDWQASGVWRDTVVSGGSAAFSEPESKAFQSYIAAHTPTAVVVWFSSAGGVFSSSCHNDVSAETSAITNIYASASGYPAFKDFDFYAITGDMVNWLAKNNIPAMSVLLSTHNDVEWSKNKLGVEALLSHYSK